MNLTISQHEGKSGIQDPAFALGQPLRILFAEDNPLDRRMAGLMFQRLGYEDADMASNGAEAVELVIEGSYDIIFMDLQMPVMNGIAATEAIRAMEGLRQPVIIVITGYGLPAVKEECLRAGVDAVLTKPAGLEDFRRILSACRKENAAAPQPLTRAA